MKILLIKMILLIENKYYNYYKYKVFKHLINIILETKIVKLLK